MDKRIWLASAIGLVLAGCGGSSGSSGSANVYGVNADPNQGNLSITANGTVVLNAAAYGSTSSNFVSVSTGANSSIFVTNSSNTSLASTTSTAGFTGGQYYAIYAFGNSSNQQIGIFPVDVSQPPSTTARLLFTNTSVVYSSVDVYVTTNTAPTGLQATATGITPFNSGFPTEVNNVPPGTYNVYFCQSGTQTILASMTGLTVGTTATTSSGATANQITMIGITDAQGTTTPVTQQALTPIVFQVVSGAAAPQFGTRAVVIGAHTSKG